MRPVEHRLDLRTQFVAERGSDLFNPVTPPRKFRHGFVPEHLERGWIRVAYVSVLVDQNADDRGFDQRAIALLALAKGALGSDAFGDVAGDDQDGFDRPVAAELGNGPRLEAPQPAGRLEIEFDGEGLAARENLRDGALPKRHVFR